METYTAQIWKQEELLSEVKNLSIDAAREVALASMQTGLVGRLFSEARDYWEVYDPRRGKRCGTFAQTTLVIGGHDERQKK